MHTMNSSILGARRRVVVTVAGMLVAIAVAGTQSGHAEDMHHAATAKAPTARTAKQLAFHDGMRKLWEDHVTWTRLAIVSFAGDLPDLSATETRLLRNQTDIGNALKPYYGRAAGKQLTALLKDHILGAVALLQAAKTAAPGWVQQA